MFDKKRDIILIYFIPQTNKNYSHNKFLFLTIPTVIKKNTCLLAPENFESEAKADYFFQLKQAIISDPLKNNILNKTARVFRFIYQSIFNTFILYKAIKVHKNKEIILIIDAYNPFDILFIPFISIKKIKIRIFLYDGNFSFFYNLIQNFCFNCIKILNNDFKIIEWNSFCKKKSYFSNGEVINHPFYGPTQSSSIKNYGNNIFLPGRYRPEKGFSNMQKILNYKKMYNYRFFLNLNSKNELISRKNFFFFRDEINGKEYLKLLKKSNFILLPYTHKKYSTSLSGIFTDCIVMNKIPVVHKDTFVGKLLRKNKLKILLYDFNDYKNFDLKMDLINKRRSLVQKKVIKFKKKYLSLFSDPAVFWGKCL
jgi:hypothetical protein